MAYNNSEHGFSANTPAITNMVLQANGPDVQLPDASYIRTAELTRDSGDLILKTADDEITIENYFSVETKPVLTAPDGSMLSPKLVDAFVKSGQEYASNASMTDESPVGNIAEISGDATVTRVDGSVDNITIGTEIYNGDIVETSAEGAVNITFIDDSSFAVSEGARLSIDEYVFDPSTESGQTDFSVLKGMFVYTSGLIGRDDPDDVTIDTPVGSIGIRGTIIAGDVDSGEITVVEGAIVLRDFDGNEVTLANQFETAKFDLDGKGIENLGELSASDVAGKFASISNVSPTLFSSIDDAATENAEDAQSAENDAEKSAEETEADEAQDTTEASSEAETGSEADAETEILETEAEAEAETKAEPESKAETEVKTEAEPESNTTPEVEAAKQESEPDNNNTQEADTLNTDAPNADIALDTATNQAAPAIDAGRPALSPITSNNTPTANTANQGPSPLAPIKTATEPAAFTKPAIPETQEVVVNTVATVLNNNIPDAKFGFSLKGTGETTTNKVFDFYFDQLFTDAEGDTLNYKLTAETRATLQDLQDQGILTTQKYDDGGNPTTILNDAQEAAGYKFDTSNGKLELYINDATEADITDLAFSLKVEAFDGDIFNNVVDATFTAYEGVDWNASTISLGNFSGANINSTSDNSSLLIEGDHDGGTLSLLNGDITDHLAETIYVSEVTNTTLLSGEGNKIIKIATDSFNNTIFGGNNAESHDELIISNVNNDIYGMNGEDTFEIKLDNLANKALEQSTKTIDGGGSSLSKAQDIASGNLAGTQDNETGDILRLFNDSGPQENVDFSAITTNFQNFEQLELSGTSGVKITLTTEDVISITDQHNTLLISGDSNDNIDFDKSNYNKADQTVEIDSQYYDVYTSNGADNVTLFVDTDITDSSGAI